MKLTCLISDLELLHSLSHAHDDAREIPTKNQRKSFRRGADMLYFSKNVYYVSSVPIWNISYLLMIAQHTLTP